MIVRIKKAILKKRRLFEKLRIEKSNSFAIEMMKSNWKGM
jgi:hypothetical protein